MDNLLLKLAAIVAIIATALAGAWLAAVFSRSDKARTALSLGAVFSAGIFLGAGLIHLIPDAMDAFASTLSGIDYPLPLLLTSFGFILAAALIYLPHRSDSKDSPPITAALVAVLSVHSILTGIALGMESRVIGSLALLLAVLSHKGSAAFALATSCLRNRMERARMWRIVLGFSLSTPLGVILGMIGAEYLEGAIGRLTEGVFDSIAAGTFLCIASLHILNEEMEAKEKIAQKLVMLVIGLCLMAAVALWL